MGEAKEAFAWSAADRDQLVERGVSVEEADRQLRLVHGPPPVMVLDRPCTPGDGILTLEPDTAARLDKQWAEAAAAGRGSLFVPASGAASRMFKELLSARARPELMDPAGLAVASDPDAAGLHAFLDGLERFAFRRSLAAAVAASGAALESLARSGPFGPILDALLLEPGLGYAEAPKGLLEFHHDPNRPHTPFEEHLREAARLVADRHGACRLHFTVSPQHRSSFENLRDRIGPRLAAELSVSYHIDFSIQDLSTDTLAGGEGGGPFRDGSGRLLFRPAGHGALIGNLQGFGGDVVFVKNVDNVAAEPHKPPTYAWSRALLGLLVGVERDVRRHLDAVSRGGAAAVEAAVAFMVGDLGVANPPAAAAERAAWVERTLRRPLRVCGMVPNTGEPGGGPYWTRSPDGAISRQIVESAQVDVADPGQLRIFRAATHFNPVFMACALRDPRGRPYDLARFVDPRASIVTPKSSGGKTLFALERPGLWNGAMADWNTLFVEVPGSVFNPVKAVLDLLRPAHQRG